MFFENLQAAKPRPKAAKQVTTSRRPLRLRHLNLRVLKRLILSALTMMD